MDSEQKWMVAVTVLFLSFLLGLLELGKVLDPYTLQAVTFRGEERRVAVHTNRRAVNVGSLSGSGEIFEENGNIVTRVTFAVPRRGIHIMMRAASPDEVKLFHGFYYKRIPQFL